MSDKRILEIIENQDKYYILGFIKGLKANINELQQENQQLKIQISAREEEYRKLKNNWNELKKWLQEEFDKQHHTTNWTMKDKMQELEKGKSE